MHLLPALLFAALAAPDPFTACHAPIAEDPDGRDGWRCVYMVARKEGAYDDALALVRGRLEARDSPGAWLTLGSLLSDQGQREAGEHFLRAAEGFAARGDARGEVYARLNLAVFHTHSGALPDGEAQLALAAAVAERAGEDVLLTTVQIQQGRLRWWAGRDLGAAWRTLRTIEAERFDTLPYQERLLVLHVLARLSDAIERPWEGVDWQRRVVALAEAEGDNYVAVTARLQVARYALDARGGVEVMPKEALEIYVDETLALAETAANPYAVASAVCLRGQLAEGAERDARYRACVDAFKETTYLSEVIESLTQWALELPPERADDALAHIDEAAALADDSDDFQYANLRWHRAIVLGRVGRDAEALVQATEALERIDASLQAQAEDLGKAGHLAHWSGLYHEVAALHLVVGDEEAAWHTLERLRARVLLDRLASAGAEGAALLAAGAPRTLPLRALQAKLGPDEALIAFQVPPRGSASRAGHVWAISAAGVSRAALPDIDTLRTRFEVYEGLLHGGDADEPRGARALYDLLLAPVLDAQPGAVRRLVFLPEGPFHALPLDALARPDGARLFERFEIAYAPSATVWQMLREQAPREAAAVLAVLADPDTTASDPATGAAFPRLPGARREADAAARRLGGAVWHGADATESAFALADARVLHVAAHAVIDPSFPEASAIHLAAGGDDDGRLEARELMGLDLRGRVVVLSACRSADGPVVGGEGPMGLARALFQGGARTVVGTRWPLPDDSAAAFFDAFYAELAKGRTVSGAVGAARAARRDAGDTPEVWAGVVVLGDGDAAPAPRGAGAPWSWWLGLLGVGATGIGGITLWRRRAR